MTSVETKDYRLYLNNRHTPGDELNCRATFFATDNLDISELVQLPEEQLQSCLQSSIREEEAYIEQIEKVQKFWAEAARDTRKYQRALEYVHMVPTVKHTGNQWVDVDEFYGEEGGYQQRISNNVYEMTVQLYVRTR